MSTSKTTLAAARLGSITSDLKTSAARKNGLRGGRPQRLTGGRSGFIAAAQEAFTAKLHDPVVRYSHARGFHCESLHAAADPDVIWERAANYILPTGRRSIRPSDYPEVSAEITGD